MIDGGLGGGRRAGVCADGRSGWGVLYAHTQEAVRHDQCEKLQVFDEKLP